jgi:hypothetical protein
MDDVIKKSRANAARVTAASLQLIEGYDRMIAAHERVGMDTTKLREGRYKLEQSVRQRAAQEVTS